MNFTQVVATRYITTEHLKKLSKILEVLDRFLEFTVFNREVAINICNLMPFKLREHRQGHHLLAINASRLDKRVQSVGRTRIERARRIPDERRDSSHVNLRQRAHLRRFHSLAGK